MWIFGYGSLVWKVDFPYVKKVIGYIKGYERRFWQASIDHRGVPEKPGRVVTLVPSSDPETSVWGVAYEIDDNNQETIAQINHRERRFTQLHLPFYPFNCGEGLKYEDFCADLSVPFPATVYVGPLEGPLFLGEASIRDIAIQISQASGPSGANYEYILNLSKFMRDYIPHVQDEHLLEIEQELLHLLEKDRMNHKLQ